ncbi:MAG: hypothetical protein FJX56_05885, partial [Alphaproteobacteria bacterium]|nr:hypothetical protein [Alphaproteobacteria bacterium]
MTLAQYVRSAPRSTLLAIALALACSTPAAAAGDITLELNKVTAPDGAACRLHFLLANDTAEGFFAFQLQMSFFDTDGG